ncbi:hypothetical protein GCM10029992_36380 [Glycomyces albus]
MFSVMTVNIGAAALERASRIGYWLTKAGDDVAVLTETSAGQGTAELLGRYHRAGWRRTAHDDLGGDRGAAVITRIAQVEAAPPQMAVSLSHRLASLSVGVRAGAFVVGVYVPSRDRSAAKVDRKRCFLTELLEAVEACEPAMRERMIIAGDFNVVAADAPQSRTMMPFELEVLPRLERAGLVDLAAAANLADEPTWVGRTGDGYRYDYIFAGAQLADQVAEVEFLHETRSLGLTDHTALRVRFNGDPDRLAVTSPAPVESPTLF